MPQRAWFDAVPSAPPNLTELELLAMGHGINVADGHARQAPTPTQQRIIDEFPALFEQAAKSCPASLDIEAQRSYLCALGQETAAREAVVLSCYSSSVAIEILARAFWECDMRRVGLVHPTFDNIPDILRGVGLDLTPVSEEQLAMGPPPVAAGALDALFITTPNNPTGCVIPEKPLSQWAHWCARSGVVLALDASFRGFDSRAQYDHYAVLTDSGCRWVVVEDTGKLWPTLDLKIGFLVFSPSETVLPLRRIYTDILLGVSPFILLMVHRLAEDAAAGGLELLRGLIEHNRKLLRNQLQHVPSTSFPDLRSRVPVERIALPDGMTGTVVSSDLRGQNIHVLPGRNFHWAAPREGEGFIRVALGRKPNVVETAAKAIRQYLEQHIPDRKS